MDNNNKQGNAKGIFKKIKGLKHIEIIIACIAILIMLAVYFSGLGGGDKSSVKAEDKVASNYCDYIQAELEDLISSLSGAGKAKVLISWETSIEKILAQNTTTSSGSSSTSTVIIQSSGSSAPIVIKEIYPKAVGVLIICQGGNDPKIQVNVTIAVTILLDISPDKVIVYGMAK